MWLGFCSDTKYQEDDSLHCPQLGHSGPILCEHNPFVNGENVLHPKLYPQNTSKLMVDGKPSNTNYRTSLSSHVTETLHSKKLSNSALSSDCLSATMLSCTGRGLREPSEHNFVDYPSQGDVSRQPIAPRSSAINDELERRWEVIEIKPNNTKKKRILVVSSTGPNAEKKGSIRIKIPDKKLPRFSRTWDVSNIRNVKKCNRGNRLLVYFKKTQVLDFHFLVAKDQADCLRYLQKLNPEFHVENKALRQYPKWDLNAKMCTICGSIFGVLNRLHHCRMCGNGVCANCSRNRAALPEFGIEKPVRVDKNCYDFILAERLGSAKDGFGSCKMLFWQEAVKENILKTCSQKQNRMSKNLKEWKRYLANNQSLNIQCKELRKNIINGIPPEFRGYIWTTISDCSKKRNCEPENYYHQLLDYSMRHNGELAFVEAIDKDLWRPMRKDLDTVYNNEKAIEMLRRVLIAYGVRNKKVEYCQSFNYIVALLLLFTNEEDAFWLFCHIVEEICCVDQRSFYHSSNNLEGWSIDRIVFTVLLEKVLPEISNHLVKLEVPFCYIADRWFLCLFVDCVPLELTLRIWDLMFLDGITIIFRSALTLLSLNQDIILAAKDYELASKILMNLTSMAVSSDMFIKECYSHQFAAVDELDSLRVFHRAHVEQSTRLNSLCKLSPAQSREQILSWMSPRSGICSRTPLMYRQTTKSTETRLPKSKYKEVNSLWDLPASSSLNEKEKMKIAELASPLIYLDPAYKNRFQQFSQYFGRIEINTSRFEEYFRKKSWAAENNSEYKEYQKDHSLDSTPHSLGTNCDSIN